MEVMRTLTAQLPINRLTACMNRTERSALHRIEPHCRARRLLSNPEAGQIRQTDGMTPHRSLGLLSGYRKVTVKAAWPKEGHITACAALMSWWRGHLIGILTLHRPQQRIPAHLSVGLSRYWHRAHEQELLGGSL